MVLEDFILEQFNFRNEEHLKLKDDLIFSENSELISKDINNYIIRTLECRQSDNISNVFVTFYKSIPIGISFINYHPEERGLVQEIEIGLGLLPIFRGQHLGSLLEKQLCNELLKIYPQFSEIVCRIDNSNISSIKAAKLAGFEHIKDDEYHYKR